MAQGDIHFYDDLAARFMRGELSVKRNVNQLYILLIDNTRLAKSSDQNAKITDYTSARSATAPSDTTRDASTSGYVYTPFGATGFVSFQATDRLLTIPFGDLRVLLNLDVRPTFTPASGANVQVKYILHYPRIPGMTNVYQAVIFDSETENCLCFIDLTPDGGVTPFDLDHYPLNINFAAPTNGSYAAGWRLLFASEAA